MLPVAPCYESIVMQNRDLPVRVEMRKSNAQSGGCILHWHEELEFYYVKKGGLSLLCNGQSQWLYPGDIGFVNWCELHRSNEFLDGTEHYIIQIGTKLFADETVSEEQQKENLLFLFIAKHHQFPVLNRDCRELQQLLDLIVEESLGHQVGYELKIKAAVYNVLVLLLRRGKISMTENVCAAKDLSSVEHLKKILAYLSFHYTNPEDVSLPELSRRFGLSVPYLCRIFKKHTTLTITSYINELRCSRAAAFIQEGIPLESVATRIGFRDYNYFSRVFTKTMGLPPSEYRKKNGQYRKNDEQESS